MPPVNIIAPLIQYSQCVRGTYVASSAPSAGPVVCPTSMPVCASASARPMRAGGVLPTMSAMPAADEPLKIATQHSRAANQNGVGANAASVMKEPMPSIARSTMILRP
jgi:hypothetical protein